MKNMAGVATFFISVRLERRVWKVKPKWQVVGWWSFQWVMGEVDYRDLTGQAPETS